MLSATKASAASSGKGRGRQGLFTALDPVLLREAKLQRAEFVLVSVARD